MHRKRERGQKEGDEEEEKSLEFDYKYSSSTSPEMACSDLFQFHSSPMAVGKGSSSSRNKVPQCFSNGFLFLVGSLIAFLLVWSFSNYVSPAPPDPNPNFQSVLTDLDSTLIPRLLPPRDCRDAAGRGVDLGFDPPEKTFYDDPNLSYSIGKPVKNWDEKRKEWLKLHPTFAAGDKERVLMMSGSQPNPCKNPIGDHLLLRFFKNKVDYCRIHGYDIFYNNVLIQPQMYSFWAKLPAVKAAMVAHPEAEWIWWVDADALFTDMDFKLPLDRYRAHNMVVHGWGHLIHDEKSWTGLNAGVFLIRNCQWSMDFMEEWAAMGPQSPDFEKWGEIQRTTLKNKMFPESDDQAALIYLLIHDKEKWSPKVYLEAAYYFEGYWLEIVGTFENITAKYAELEWEERSLRRRHAEKVSECHAAHKEAYVKDWGGGRGSLRRPPVTHFAGCQPCSGDHNRMYSGQSCWDGMVKALNFADNQVLRKFGFMRPDLLDSTTVKPVPFDAAA